MRLDFRGTDLIATVQVDIEDEQALTDDAFRVEEEEIFVIDDAGYET